MNQTTAFSPHLVCKLIDGRIVRFARSSWDHWTAIAEEIAQERRDRILARIAADTEMPADQRRAEIDAAWDIIVSVPAAIDLGCRSGKWVKRHLTEAYKEAGGSEADAPEVLKLISSDDILGIARVLAMQPIVKNVKAGSEENPLVLGVDLGASVSTTGEQSPSPVDTASTPAS